MRKQKEVDVYKKGTVFIRREISKGRTKMKSKFIIVGLFIAMSLLLSGCFFSEQTLVIGPDGKTDVKVEFWFDKTQAGDQGAIGMQELLYLFPELQNYEVTKTEKDIGYSTYLIYSFKASDVDINKNRYIDFTKRDDESYSLMITIPKTIEEKEESNDKVLTIRVTLPAEIDMANTLDYKGRTAEWELRQNDFTKDIILKAFTKVPVEKEASLKVMEDYYKAVFIKQDELLVRTYYSEKTSSLLIETIRTPTEIKNQLTSKEIGFEDYTKKILTATYIVDQEWLEESVDPENESLVEVEFNEEIHRWKIVKEGGKWKIAMPVDVTKEQGEIWLKSTPETEPFFDLSTPENTLRSFMEASVSGDKETAKGCWFSRMPETLVESFVGAMMKAFEDTHPEFLKFLVRGTHYGSEKVNEDNYYAFTIPPGSKKRSETIVHRVTRENDYWKILIPKGMENHPFF